MRDVCMAIRVLLHLVVVDPFTRDGRRRDRHPETEYCVHSEMGIYAFYTIMARDTYLYIQLRTA
jgi:hypothetical protein